MISCVCVIMCVISANLDIVPHTRQSQNGHIRGTGPTASLGRDGKGRARGHHIIDQHDIAPLNHMAFAGMWDDRLIHILITGIAGPAFLRRSGAQAQQRHRLNLRITMAGKRPRQQSRLIEAPPGQPRPMQRDGHQQRIILQQISGGARHPRPRSARNIGTVTMLERQDKFATDALIGKHGTRMIPRTRHALAFAANQRLTLCRSLTRQAGATEVAGRTKNERGIAPTGTANRKRIFHARRTIEAFRRKHRMQHGLQSHERPLDTAQLIPAQSLKLQQPRLTDANALAAHRIRAMPRIADARFLHDEAIAELQERLRDVNRRFTRTLIVSDFPKIWRDLAPDAKIIPMTEDLRLQPGAHDLVIHAMGLHWADDPVGQVVQCARALAPDGLFLSVAFGGSTLTELRQSLAQAEAQVMGGLSPRVAPMAEVRDMGALLQRAGLALPVADTLRKTVTYADTLALMHDLRAMGETNALDGRHKAVPPRALFPTAMAIYAETFPAEENRIQASFEFVFLTGWAPHESQQKPLRPGAATSRLAEALGTTEFDEGANPVHDLPDDGSSNQK